MNSLSQNQNESLQMFGVGAGSADKLLKAQHMLARCHVEQMNQKNTNNSGESKFWFSNTLVACCFLFPLPIANSLFKTMDLACL